MVIFSCAGSYTALNAAVIFVELLKDFFFFPVVVHVALDLFEIARVTPGVGREVGDDEYPRSLRTLCVRSDGTVFFHEDLHPVAFYLHIAVTWFSR